MDPVRLSLDPCWLIAQPIHHVTWQGPENCAKYKEPWSVIKFVTPIVCAKEWTLLSEKPHQISPSARPFTTTVIPLSISFLSYYILHEW